MMQDISSLRRNYKLGILDEKVVPNSPYELFTLWFTQAKECISSEVNAFILSTINNNNAPNARVVLLKEFTEGSFVFYTNYESQKGKDIAYNNNVSMCFLWHELERQVRISGQATKVDRQQSEEYFQSRPRESQLGAWASHQSQPIESRELLENRYAEVVSRFEGVEPLPLPDFWGGYAITPNKFEFWQGRENRLHDRLVYSKHENHWQINRLLP